MYTVTYFSKEHNVWPGSTIMERANTYVLRIFVLPFGMRIIVPRSCADLLSFESATF